LISTSILKTNISEHWFQAVFRFSCPGGVDVLAGREFETCQDLLDQFRSVGRRQIQRFTKDLFTLRRHKEAPAIVSRPS
jgi:hypothetical protein